MKVFVKKATKIEGISQTNNKPYEFVNALVLFEDKVHAKNIKVNKLACDDLDKIKPGSYFDMYVDGENVLSFDLVKAAPEASADEVVSVKVDGATGEVIEEIKAGAKQENKAGGQEPGKK